MSKKTLIMPVLLLVSLILSGCGLSEKEKPLNPLDVDSMVDTYEDSKDKIKDAAQLENDKINKALEDSGLK
jgi:outer membrane biogenesis lipoprotein LolB